MTFEGFRSGDYQCMMEIFMIDKMHGRSASIHNEFDNWMLHGAHGSYANVQTYIGIGKLLE